MRIRTLLALFVLALLSLAAVVSTGLSQIAVTPNIHLPGRAGTVGASIPIPGQNPAPNPGTNPTSTPTPTPKNKGKDNSKDQGLKDLRVLADAQSREINTLDSQIRVLQEQLIQERMRVCKP